MTDPPDWLALSGKIGVGKTTVARCLVGHLGAAYMGFGDFVRADAERLGVELTRRRLQDLGDSLIATLGADGFVGEVAAHAGVQPGLRVVVDGVRSPEIIAAVKALAAPAQLHVVHLEIPEELRLERLRQRGLRVDEVAAADEHPSEQALSAIRDAADLITASRDSRAICREIFVWLTAQ